MTLFTWEDCRLAVDGAQVVMENDALRTVWTLCDEGLTLRCVENRPAHFCWQHTDGSEAPFAACMTPPASTPQWDAEAVESPLHAPYWLIRCTWRRQQCAVQRCFVWYPHAPFLTTWAVWESPSPEAFCAAAPADASADGTEKHRFGQNEPCVPGDVMLTLPLPRRHLRWHCVRLADQTDMHDTLVWQQGAPVYPMEPVARCGSFFTVEDVLTGQTLLAARHAPVPAAGSTQFRLWKNDLQVLQNSGFDACPAETSCCACVIGAAAAPALWQQYRAFYRLGWRAPWQQQPLIVSNTWGDRSRDARVCERFILQEIDRAAALGADVVQIDDGWQKGVTVNSACPTGGVWEGYYAADPHFWTPHPTRFPDGLAPVTAYAAAHGVRLGLWFSPDSSHDFCQWQRDVQTVLQLWQTCGIAVFKLDGVKLRTPLARSRYLAFLHAVCAQSGGCIALQQDITAEQRLGYLAERSYGTLFVENRYTDFGNYYPHRTLRNLWMLSRYIPAQRMLFEVLNPRRNSANYANDPFAPGLYPADYLFACAMPAQPLLWMELTGLAEKDFARLRQVIGVYRRHREDMWACDIRPIGQEPNGRAFTGFLFGHSDQKAGYLLVFRESTAARAFAFAQVPRDAQWTLLYANAPVRRACTAAGELRVEFAAPRSFALYRWARP